MPMRARAVAGVVDQPVAFQRFEVGVDARERGRALALCLVVERDLVAGAGEDDRPGAADQARADDRDLAFLDGGHGGLLRRPCRRCG